MRWLLSNTVREALKDYENGLTTGSLLNLLQAALNRPLPHERKRELPSFAPQDPIINLMAESSRAPHASAFLTARPLPQITMSNSEFRDALWIRLGLPAPPGHCVPAPANDRMGFHRLGCRNSAGYRIRRDDDLLSVIASTALTADAGAFQIAREEKLPEAEGSRSRPGDVALNLGSGRLLVDVTVASPFTAAGHLSTRLAGLPDAAAESAYDGKLAKWHRIIFVLQLNIEDFASTFQPLAVTSLGVWEKCSMLWLRRSSDVCATASSVDQGTALSHLMARFSVALWKGNSRMLRDLHEIECPAPDPASDTED